jgi:hypothetical protein
LVLSQSFYSQARKSIPITITITITIRNPITNAMTYSIDSYRELKIYSLVFHDSYSSVILANSGRKHSLDQCLELVKTILTGLESSTSAGFLPSHNLLEFPVISVLLPSFILGGKEYVQGGKSTESYKWIYNLLILSLSLVCVDTMQRTVITPSNADKVRILKTTEQELYGRLDPSIRHYLQKRGISIHQNTYVGFDTEFMLKGSGLNSLISAQLAVTTKSYVKIPKKIPYQISRLNESNKIIELNNQSSEFNYPKLEASINMLIEGIRSLKYANQDVSMLILSEGLKFIKGITYTELEDHTVFSLPRSLIQPYIQFGGSISLKEILGIASGISQPLHAASNTALMKLIRGISTSDFNLLDGKERLEEAIIKKYGCYTEIEEMESSFDRRLPLQEASKGEVLN